MLFIDNGYTIYYDASSSANSWLDGKTYTLTDGGKLTPPTKNISSTPPTGNARLFIFKIALLHYK